MSAEHNLRVRPAHAEGGVTRWVALLPVWIGIRMLALGLAQTHWLRRLSFGSFVIRAKERAFWVGVALYGSVAIGIRLLSGIVTVPWEFPLLSFSFLR